MLLTLHVNKEIQKGLKVRPGQSAGTERASDLCVKDTGCTDMRER